MRERVAAALVREADRGHRAMLPRELGGDVPGLIGACIVDDGDPGGVGDPLLDVGEDGGDAASQLVESIFQVTKVTRPLMSVSKICDERMKAEFDAQKATITCIKTGKVLCVFKRVGGLYVAKMRLKLPFRRPA